MQGEEPQQNSQSPVGEDSPSGGENPSWNYKPEEPAVVGGENVAPQLQPQHLEAVEWTASEYIAHHKTPGWFVMVGVATSILAILVYFVSRGDIISTCMMIVVGVVFGVIGGRVPRVLEYSLDDSGIRIGPKFYTYGDFKSFAIQDEGAISSISLLPLKRFMPSISIYYAPEDEEKIIQVLSLGLPIEHREQDALDRLMRRLRF